MSIRRLAPLTGVLGPLFVILGLVTMDAPDASLPDADIARWFATHDLGQWFLSAVAVAVGGLLMLVFAAVVAGRQEEVGATPAGRQLTVVAGTAWGILTLMGASVYASFPVTHMFMGTQPPGVDLYRYLGGVFYGTLVVFCALAAALLAITLSVTSLRTGLLPRALAVIGIPASLLMLANAMMPMAVITLWFGATSIALVVRGGRAPVATEVRLPAQAATARA